MWDLLLVRLLLNYKIQFVSTFNHSFSRLGPPHGLCQIILLNYLSATLEASVPAASSTSSDAQVAGI